MAEFRVRLRELRQQRGVSQQELADHLGVHKVTISGYERGIRRPKFPVLDEIADYLDASMDYLLGNSDINSHYPRHGEDTFADKLIRAYAQASPDTQAAVRAILHLEA